MIGHAWKGLMGRYTAVSLAGVLIKVARVCVSTPGHRTPEQSTRVQEFEYLNRQGVARFTGLARTSALLG
eukprot:9728521-Lingulodinium_polyedra.AAC.1